MALLTPLYLLGLAAVSLPIVLHMIRRSPRGRYRFSSLMFLSPTPPRVTKRSRLEHWPLLLLRALAIILLALAFGRPYLETLVADSGSQSQAKRVVFLLDRSASMQRGDLMQQAVAAIEQELASRGPHDRVAIAGFGRSVQPIVSFAEWTAVTPGERAAMAMARLRETKPGWSDTRLGHALLAATMMLRDDLAQSENKKRTRAQQIVLLSDMQSGSSLRELRGTEWPKDVRVKVAPLKAKESANNATLAILREPTIASSRKNDDLRVRVSNDEASQREQFALRWVTPPSNSVDNAKDVAPDEHDEGAVKAYVPAGASRVVEVPLPRNIAGEELQRVLTLEGDDEPFDNRAYRTTVRARQVPLLYIGDEAATDSEQHLYYLLRAFPATPSRVVTIAQRDGASPLRDSDHIQPWSLAVVTKPCDEAHRAMLRAMLDAGRTVLWIANASPSAGFAELLNIGTESPKPVTVDDAEVADYALVSRIDFDHPMFQPLADPRFRDFTKIHVWKHRQWDSKGMANAKPRVLAHFDDDSPAIIEFPAGKLGRGRLIVMNTSWRPIDSQLAVSSKFVPMLNSLLDASIGQPPRPPAMLAGVPMDLGAWLGRGSIESPPAGAAGNSVGDETIAVLKPDGASVEAPRDQPFTPPMPGVYQATYRDRQHTFAVNLAPAESRTSPMPLETLEKLGVALESVTPSPQAQEDATRRLLSIEAEDRQKVWRWLVAAAIIALVLETWLAGRIASRNNVSQEPAAAA